MPDGRRVAPVTGQDVDPTFARLFEPLTIGDFTVRNRIVMTAHEGAQSDAREIRYTQERARGGVGLIGLSTRSAGVDSYNVGPYSGYAVPRADWDQDYPSPIDDDGIAFFDDLAIPRMSKLAEVIHAEGARCFAQVAHAGTVMPWSVLRAATGPSNVPDPYNGWTPHALTGDEIEQLVVAFGHGIRRVREAGVDAAEIHGAHGALIHAFLSPYSNHRTDEWGGSLENRMRFLDRIIAEARRHVGPTYPIGVRLGLHSDSGHRQMTLDDLLETARHLSPLVQYVNVSSGGTTGLGDGYETAYVSPWYKEPAFNAPIAAKVRQVVDVPVMVAGRVNDPAVAESMLAEGSADLVGMVRPLIADPDLPNKARTGRAGQIRTCLALNECHHHGKHRVPMTCAVNAAAGREDEISPTPAAVPRRVAVVGAGPAGLEAARVAALRGHSVFLCDSGRAIGGTVRVLAGDPNRRNLRDHSAYFEAVLPDLGVELLLGNEVGADELADFGLDVVVVATGARPFVPDVPGMDGDNVVTALEVLRGEVEPTGHVVVVGGRDNHLAGPTMAEYLVDRGCTVELLSERFDFADGVEDGTRLPLMERLKNKDVSIGLTTRVVGVQDGGATVMDVFTRRTRDVEAATFVLACGLVPEDRLARELRGRVPEVHVIGDALAPRRIMHATIEGARVAVSL